MDPQDIHMSVVALLSEEPSQARGRTIVQGIALHDGSSVALRSEQDDSLLCTLPLDLLQCVLPVTGKLAEWYVGADLYIVCGERVLKILGDPDELVPRLFRKGGSGHLDFGLAAQSASPAEPSTLETDVVIFKENVLEAPVAYGLSMTQRPDSVILSIHLLCSSRDAQIPGWVRWSLSRSGFNLS